MKKGAFIFGLILVLILSVGCSSSSSGGSKKASDYPKGNVEIIAPATPGGGYDSTARSMQKVLEDQKLVSTSMSVVNKPGGNGAVGWNYLKGKNANTISVNSSLILLNNLLGSSDLSYKNFTPLATLTTEWEAVVVAKDSPIQSAKELMEKLKADPTSLKVAVAPGLGNDDHLAFVQAAKTFGVDIPKLQFLVYGSGGDTVTALLGHHVDVATMSVSEAVEQYKAGKFRILAVTSDKRIEGLDDVPTWKEQGVDMVFPHWRGVMGPPNMTKEQIAYWDDKISKMVKSDAWKEILKNNDWESFYKNAADTKKFLKEQNDMYKDLIDASGLVK